MSCDLRIARYRCLLCNALVAEHQVLRHKETHGRALRYGTMWPTDLSVVPMVRQWRVPTYESRFLADALGVRKVFVRNEGAAPSGSMKDYGVERIVAQGKSRGAQAFFVVSSGNHAVSLALASRRNGVTAILFAPASSSKLPFLEKLPGVVTIGMEGAIFEDVYNRVALIRIANAWNANVSNEEVMPAFASVGAEIAAMRQRPTHILAGVGNGTYLAGIGLGLHLFSEKENGTARIVPVGMAGAFPTEEAFAQGASIHEYQSFAVPESSIDAAEGSIATESYSMPQLMEAVRLSDGFPLGGMTNDDIAHAYEVLSQDDALMRLGVVPEPTGIMSLAAALKWRSAFGRNDAPLLSFTGHGIKDTEGIARLVPRLADRLIEIARSARPDLEIHFGNEVAEHPLMIVEKNIRPEELEEAVRRELALQG